MSDAKPVRKEVVVGDKRYHAYIDSRDCLEGKLVIKQRFMEGGSFFGKIITKEIPISPYDCLGYGTEYNFSAERQNKTHELILFFKDRGFTKLKAEKNIVHIAAGSTLQKVVINKNCAVKQKFRLKTTFAIEEEKEMFGNVIYKVRLDSVPIFFSNKQLEIIKDKRKTATNVDRIWLYDCKVTADTIKEGTYYTRQNASILIEMLQGNIAELSNKTYKFITLNNAKDCSELEVNTKQLSKIFYLKETKGLLKDEAKHTFTVGSNHLELEVYKENPYTVEESKQAQEEEFREGEKAITRYNGKEYVLLKKESDSVCEYVEYKGLKKVNLFDWKQFFYIAEQDANDDVFCDVKEEILDQIALTDEVKNKIAQAFERDESLQEALAGEEAVRVSLRKIIVGHPLEFDAALYENEEVFKKKGCTPESCKRLKEDVKSVSFWDDIKIKEKNALVFAHPLYFLNHLNKAGVFEFNPYEGKTYRELYVGNGENKLYDGGDYGAKIVSSNPGFAAVFNSRCWGKSFDGYTGVTGFFNADYKAVHSDYTEYWHEGIDFRGPQGTAVHSLVQGTVLRCGKAVSASMGGFILIKALTDENLYYLAIHLDANTIKNYVEQGSAISPGMQVAETMLLRNSDGKNVSHLHVSVIKLPEGVEAVSKTGIIMPEVNTFPIWGQEHTKNQEIWKNMINPFNYTDPIPWKGRY